MLLKTDYTHRNRKSTFKCDNCGRIINTDERIRLTIQSTNRKI